MQGTVRAVHWAYMVRQPFSSIVQLTMAVPQPQRYTDDIDSVAPQGLILCLGFNLIGTVALLIGVGGDNLSSLLWAGDHALPSTRRGVKSRMHLQPGLACSVLASKVAAPDSSRHTPSVLYCGSAQHNRYMPTVQACILWAASLARSSCGSRGYTMRPLVTAQLDMPSSSPSSWPTWCSWAGAQSVSSEPQAGGLRMPPHSRLKNFSHFYFLVHFENFLSRLPPAQLQPLPS